MKKSQVDQVPKKATVEVREISTNTLVRLEDTIRDLRDLLKDGYTHIELRNAVVYHPSYGPTPAKDHIMPDSL